MTTQRFTIAAMIVFLICSSQLIANSQFTYQGELTETGAPANGQFDMEFTLWNAATGGVQQGATVALPNVPVSDGKFTVQLDFGVSALGPADGLRWLEIAVDGFVLDPRQPLSPAPFAVQTRGIYVDDANNVGIGTTAPANLLHLRGSEATLRLDDASDANSYSLIDDASSGQLTITKHASSGNVLIDINPQPAVNTEGAGIRLFRGTDTTGAKGLSFYRGNNTTQTSAAIGVDEGDSYFQIDHGGGGGKFGIGTAAPEVKLHVSNGDSGQAISSTTDFVVEDDQFTRLQIASAGDAQISLTGGNGLVGNMQLNTVDELLSIGFGLAYMNLDGNSGFVGIRKPISVDYPLEVGFDDTNGNGAHVTVGGEWVNGSDRNSKEDFEPIDRHDILARLVHLPITQWRFKGEEETVQHLGPVAQDFHAAFGLGDSDRYIGTLDASGVALAAIQGLFEIVSEREGDLDRQRERNLQQARQIEELLARLQAVETQLGR